jgi:hypothetical protein
LPAGVEAEAGHVERQSLRGDAQFQHAIGNEMGQRQALSLGQGFHQYLLQYNGADCPH